MTAWNSSAKAAPIDAIVLAAGFGTRMRSQRIKVLHRLCGRPMLEYTLRLLEPLGVRRTVLVLGHQSETVAESLRSRGIEPPDLQIALQADPRGTADAVRTALPFLPKEEGAHVLILYGDTPLLKVERLQALLDTAKGRALALLSTRLPDPAGYGRLLRDAGGAPARIVEDRDCSPAERSCNEVNAGMYAVEGAFLRRALSHVRPNNAQREFYLTDLLAEAVAEGAPVEAVVVPADEVLGVNDRVDLARAEALLRHRINEEKLRSGVTLRDPEHTYIDDEVEIGADSEIGPGVVLSGRTRIGARCRIDAGCVLNDVTVADDSHVKAYSVATESILGPAAQVGPFSHLRPGSVLERDVHIGNFVELKKTHVGTGSKANHLAYLGDAEIGAAVNVGCGTITCNYDGVAKHRTVIEDGVFIGSDTQLVAPVRVGQGAIIAAGTTVTRDVPPGALSLSRVPQVDKPGYAETLRARLQQRRPR
jgi:bifunctional UDP-N-acetylglucosamine pyrophosphorylase/glucosamine-1-phosphate N-acetyltransferase